MIVITSRDFAILLLYRCLRHSHTEHELRTIFSSSQLFQKAIENLRLHFLKIFLQTKFYFFTHLLYAKSTLNSDRRLYKKRWCDQMRTWFNSYIIVARLIIFHRSLSRDALISFHRLLSRNALISFHRSLSRNVFIEREVIRSLEQHEIERICLWSMI